jgi:hypothetical protein
MELPWILAALVGLVLAAVVWVIWHSRSDRSALAQLAPEAGTPKRVIKPTWGKTVVVPDPAKACEAVLKISGQSFPEGEVPRLPLASCSSADCKCYFIPARERRFRPERRSGKDRRTGLRFEPGQPGDRRSGKDRRNQGHYDWDKTI